MNKQTEMTVMYFNTRHCLNASSRRIDVAAVAEAIGQCGADIVGLGEIRGKGIHPSYAPQTELLASHTGIEHSFFAKAKTFAFRGPYGNALLSRLPILDSEVIPIPLPKRHARTGSLLYEKRCVLKAVLEGGITVLVTHLGLNADERENGIRVLLDNLPSEKGILMGDFNMSPNDPLFLPIMQRMTDTADFFEERSCKLSYPADKPSCKLDYVFVTRDAEVVAADVPPIEVSDHRPCVARVVSG